MQRRWLWLLLAHALAWLVLALFAALTAGPHSFARCWPIILVYVPPMGVPLLAAGAYSAVTLAICVFSAQMRNTIHLRIAAHVMVALLGIIACWVSADAYGGPAYCQ